MRLLVGDGAPGDVRPDDLGALLAYPDPLPARGWVRASMVSSVDGAASGADGVSGSVSSGADRQVFATYRGLADAILVGSATAAAERYADPEPKPAFADRRASLGQAPAPAMAVVTGSGRVPDRLLERPGYLPDERRWRLLVLTCASAPGLDDLRGRLGRDAVVVVGDDRVDLAAAVDALVERGLPRVLCEGGPTVLAQVAAAGRLDELYVTTSPLLVAGAAGRVVTGAALHAPLHLAHLLEHDGTLVARWLLSTP